MEANVIADPAGAQSRVGRGLSVLLVWGVRFMREGLAEILERDPMVSVVGQCAELSEAVAASAALRPDIVLLDARMPGAAAAVKRALDISPGLRIVASAVRETEDDVIAWVEAGVVGYIPRSTALSDFVRLILDIHGGEQLCSGKIATGLMRRVALAARRSNGRQAALPVLSLTRRERQTAELIASGLTDKEIARRLNISIATTKAHVHNLLGKLNVQRRGQVAGCLREYDQSQA